MDKKNDEKFLEILKCDNDRPAREFLHWILFEMPVWAQTHWEPQIWQNHFTTLIISFIPILIIQKKPNTPFKSLCFHLDTKG